MNSVETGFSRRDAYPAMKEAAEFILGILVETPREHPSPGGW